MRGRRGEGRKRTNCTERFWASKHVGLYPKLSQEHAALIADSLSAER